MKWRKVWKDDPASTFASLCPTTKAVAYFLVCNANDDGGVGPSGENWKANVCKSLGIPTRQRKVWFRCLDELMEDRWLTDKNGIISIRNFARFQGHTRAAKVSRANTQKASPRHPELVPKVPELVPKVPEPRQPALLVEDNHAKSLERKLQEEKRIEEKRRDVNNARARATGGAPAAAIGEDPNQAHEQRVSVITRAYQQRFEYACQMPWAPARHYTDLHTIATLVHRMDGEDFDAKANAVLDALFANKWAREHGYPLAYLAKHFAAIVRPAAKLDDPDDLDRRYKELQQRIINGEV